MSSVVCGLPLFVVVAVAGDLLLSIFCFAVTAAAPVLTFPMVVMLLLLLIWVVLLLLMLLLQLLYIHVLDQPEPTDESTNKPTKPDSQHIQPA